jgi:hypothetical protein
MPPAMHPLDDQHTGENRIAREVTHELRLIGRHILDADREFVAAHRVHTVNHEERIAVRQGFEDLADVSRFDDLS